MKCKICGSESGSYPLCRTCYAKREAGEIINASNAEAGTMPVPPATVKKASRYPGPPLKRSFHFYMKQNHLL